MPRVGFEPKIPAFERAKTVHALDCAATVIGLWNVANRNMLYLIMLQKTCHLSSRLLLFTHRVIRHRQRYLRFVFQCTVLASVVNLRTTPPKKTQVI
jgi:hypothetical protein